ncbi:MAG: hypothetical protein ACRDRU_15825 [Pseudonocardiaceae bacterium]
MAGRHRFAPCLVVVAPRRGGALSIEIVPGWGRRRRALVEHLVTGAVADGRGRYVAVCGARVLPASLTAPGGFCPHGSLTSIG